MNNDEEFFIFIREVTRLYGEYDRCTDIQLKKEIIKDLMLLKDTVTLLLLGDNAR